MESAAINEKNLTNTGTFRLNINFVFYKKGNKQATKSREKRYVSILYLNLAKHTIVIKQHITFLNPAKCDSRRCGVTVAIFALTQRLLSANS